MKLCENKMWRYKNFDKLNCLIFYWFTCNLLIQQSLTNTRVCALNLNSICVYVCNGEKINVRVCVVILSTSMSAFFLDAIFRCPRLGKHSYVVQSLTKCHTVMLCSAQCAPYTCQLSMKTSMPIIDIHETIFCRTFYRKLF